MTANSCILQPIPVITDPEWIGMTTRARLLQLFDAVWGSTCDLVIFQRDEPDAPDALSVWCRARKVSFVARPVTPAIMYDAIIDVVGPLRGRISVYVLRAPEVA